MKKPLMILIAIIAILGFGSAAVLTTNKTDPGHHDMVGMQGHSSSASATEVVATDHVVIKDFAYAPARITVKKGTKVTWTNQDSAHHDITPDKDGADFAASKLLAQGESYSFTFEKTGVYAYHCSPHPYMKATVEVTE